MKETLPALLAIAFASSGAASAASAASAATPPPLHVVIRDHAFIPRVARVKLGQPIVWTNTDQDPHTITSGANNTDDGRWVSSGLIPDGDTFTVRLRKVGTYPYFCKPHQFQDSMHGTIIVVR